jgi:transposase
MLALCSKHIKQFLENISQKVVRRMGRHDKLTPEIQQKIVDALRMGNYVETAAAYAGIHKSTLYEWLKRGARSYDENDKFRKFADAVEIAMAEAEMRDVAVIAKASKDNWQAAAWRLERKYPGRWGLKTQHEISGKDGNPIEISHPKQLLAQRLEELAKKREEKP